MTEQFFIDVDEKDKILCVLDNALGDNTWLICSHGFFQDKCEIWFMLSKIAKALSDIGISICRYDARGCGDSTNKMGMLDLGMFVKDLNFMVEYIKDMFRPSKIILVGVGTGCYAVASLVKDDDISAVVLLNPTFNTIFNYEKDISDEVKEIGEKMGYINISRATVSKLWLDKLYESGIEYENILGQKVSVKFLKHLAAIKLLDVVKRYNMKRSLYVISAEKSKCVENCLKLIQENPCLDLKILNTDPLFSHPKIQEEIILIMKEWLKSIWC